MEGEVAPFKRLRIARIRPGGVEELEDPVAVEEPVEITVAGRSILLYALPGMLDELAAGYAYTELRLDPPFWVSEGRVSKEPVEGWRRVDAPPSQPFQALTPGDVVEAMDSMLSSAELHRRTGAVHLAGVLGRGGMLVRAEDVSRHRAVDKAVGALLLGGQHPGGFALLVSSRVTYTLALKAAAAGFWLLASRGAVTTAAVEVALDAGMCLAGFVRGDRLNLYTPCRGLGY